MFSGIHKKKFRKICRRAYTKAAHGPPTLFSLTSLCCCAWFPFLIASSECHPSSPWGMHEAFHGLLDSWYQIYFWLMCQFPCVYSAAFTLNFWRDGFEWSSTCFPEQAVHTEVAGQFIKGPPIPLDSPFLTSTVI